MLAFSRAPPVPGTAFVLVKPVGSVSVRKNSPFGMPAKLNSPVGAEVVVPNKTPAVLIRRTTAPPRPGSPASRIPFPFRSWTTSPLIVWGASGVVGETT